MEKNQKPVRPVLSLANQSKKQKKDSSEKEKKSIKENIRRSQAESHYTQTLRNALKDVISNLIKL